ncbi:MAG TPA: hypothetical protein VG051_03710 [Candidatus Acidoferrum sp.]|jgi:hypothetical protein|nr:hypothetical protein [Candidatus Acidoferrum sp.]
MMTQSSATQRGSEQADAQFNTDRTHPGRWTIAQARRAKVRNVGYGVPSDFELNFGRYLPTFGRAEDDATGQER